MSLLASASIIEHFSSIPDPRLNRRKRHKLSDIFFITLCASICSANDWVAVEYNPPKISDTKIRSLIPIAVK